MINWFVKLVLVELAVDRKSNRLKLLAVAKTMIEIA